MIMELRVVNFTTSKTLVVKSTIFFHCNIRKYTWTSPERKACNQIDLDRWEKAVPRRYSARDRSGPVAQHEAKAVPCYYSVRGRGRVVAVLGSRPATSRGWARLESEPTPRRRSFRSRIHRTGARIEANQRWRFAGARRHPEAKIPSRAMKPTLRKTMEDSLWWKTLLGETHCGTVLGPTWGTPLAYPTLGDPTGGNPAWVTTLRGQSMGPHMGGGTPWGPLLGDPPPPRSVV
jgi:hypothetical protein